MITVMREGTDSPTAHCRRSLYLLNRRIYNPSFLMAFDRPTVTGSICHRDQAPVPSQSLALMNDQFVLEQAKCFAKRVVETAGNSIDKQIELSFRLACGRMPQAEERKWAHELLKTQTDVYNSTQTPPDDVQTAAMACLCQTIISTNEFLYVE